MRVRHPAISALVPPFVAFGVLLGTWEGYVRLFSVNRLVLPPPSAVAAAVWNNPGRWWGDAWVTGRQALLGFGIAFVVAIGLAVIATHARSFERALLPVVTVVQVIPVIALGPALLVWLGLGLAPKVVVAALISFVPLTVNSLRGFQAVDRDTLEVLRSVNASRREVFVKLRLPHAVPYLLAATRVCVALALIGAMVAEWQGSSEGLGYTFIRAQRALATDQMWAAVFVLAFMGVVWTTLIGLLERRLLRWQPARLRQ